MVELEKQIDNLDKQLQSETITLNENIINSLEAHYLAALENEKMLYKTLNAQKNALLKSKEKTVGYSSLLREVETNRKIYDQLLEHMKEISIANGITDSAISIIDEAFVPYAPFSASFMRQLALGSLLGIFLGIIFAFTREYFDDRIKTTKELEQLTILPILGNIPHNQNKVNFQDQKYDKTSSLEIEAFQSLTANLEYLTDDIPRIIHITSTQPGEGKSITALQLAKTFAQNESKVLLIDADLRKPSLYKYFSAFENENFKSLSDYLQGHSTVEELTKKSACDNLSVLLEKRSTFNPAKLLANNRFITLLDYAMDHFDFIIIDSPPVMGLADALILANRSIATLFVVASNETKRTLLVNALKRIQLGYGQVIGFVLTKDKSTPKEHYGFDYYYDNPPDQDYNYMLAPYVRLVVTPKIS